MTDTAPHPTRAWCNECRKMSVVEDQFIDSNYEPGGEYEYQVTVLACGHDQESPEVRVGPAPGAPYVGPQTIVQASLRPADRRAYDAAKLAASDPWAER